MAAGCPLTRRALVSGALALGVFALLAVAYPRRPVAHWDVSVAKAVARHLPTAVEWLARPFGWVGGGVGVAVVAAVAAGILLQRSGRLEAMAGVSAYVVAEVATQLLKRAFDRPRPTFDPVVDLPRTAAFPSGHASVSMAVLVVVAVLLAGRRVDRGAVAAAVAISVAIGLSRVALGVHWLSDVVAGWAVGLVVAATVLVVGEGLRRRR